jgi:hypothetical protein
VFWIVLVTLSFSIPLIKSLSKELPPVPPGIERPSIAFVLPDEYGADVDATMLRGHILVVTELPLANEPERERVFDGIRTVRRRLRNMGQVVVYVVLCHGGSTTELSALLDRKTARKPVNVYLLDEGHEEMDLLRQQGGSRSATFLAVDRHGRIRGAFGDDEAGVDALVQLVGLLGNWPGADPAPETP